MKRLKLSLYITGRTVISERAIGNLQSICEEHFPGNYDLVIIDLLVQRGLIKKAGIIATPTLIKESPAPVRRLIGDFSDTERVLYGLR